MKYFPSNGTDFMYFEELNCVKCSKQKRCKLVSNAQILSIEPSEWIYKYNKPNCTAIKPFGTPNKKRDKTKDLPKLF